MGKKRRWVGRPAEAEKEWSNMEIRHGMHHNHVLDAATSRTPKDSMRTAASRRALPARHDVESIKNQGLVSVVD